jgi:hypothetical protein
MASEEERAKILAEYLAGDDNAEDEEEFEDDEDDLPSQAQADYPLLQGRLKFNDEQHLLYLGTWRMNQSGSNPNKFKLKSTLPLPNLDLLAKPTDSKTIIISMNGFFHTLDHRKIKEKGVELVFRHTHNDDDNDNDNDKYQVTGKGTNEFGNFTLEGIYTPPSPSSSKKEYWLQCQKHYQAIVNDDDDDDADSVIPSDSEEEDPQELNELQQDAQLSVEQLRNKYYSGGNDGDGDDDEFDNKPPATKKQKLVQPSHDGNDDDDDDEDCGF